MSSVTMTSIHIQVAKWPGPKNVLNLPTKSSVSLWMNQATYPSLDQLLGEEGWEGSACQVESEPALEDKQGNLTQMAELLLLEEQGRLEGTTPDTIRLSVQVRSP